MEVWYIIFYSLLMIFVIEWGNVGLNIKNKDMLDMQQVFSEIREAKKEMKDLGAQYKDALSQADNYQETGEKIKELREEKKKIETKIQQQLGKAYEKLEELKAEVATKEELLNDIAMTTLMDGKTVEVVDEFQNRYEPMYVVRFKKTNEIRKEEV
jgi:peptidoglycan hydrolase CwlO-like protein